MTVYWFIMFGFQSFLSVLLHSVVGKWDIFAKAILTFSFIYSASISSNFYRRFISFLSFSPFYFLYLNFLRSYYYVPLLDRVLIFLYSISLDILFLLSFFDPFYFRFRFAKDHNSCTVLNSESVWPVLLHWYFIISVIFNSNCFFSTFSYKSIIDCILSKYSSKNPYIFLSI